MRDGVGYKLPDGEAYTGDLSCALVFYPDKKEYRRALLGSILYFETWLAWERDDDKRGQDAAQAWHEANICTLECWDMACITELLEAMESSLALLANRKDCCDSNVTYGLQDEIETEIDPGVGDPPDEYGETAIETWAEWEEHVCYNAHVYVDNLKNMGMQLLGAVEQKSLYLGLIAALLVAGTFVGLLLPVAWLLASFVVTGLALAATALTFADTANELEVARDDIVCSLLQGGSLATVVENAIGSAAWELFYQYIDYDSATAIIYAGGVEGDYLPAETRDDCVCEDLEEGQLISNPSWVEGMAAWTFGGDWTWTAGSGDHLGVMSSSPVDQTTLYEDFQSANFYIPIGITSVMPQIRVKSRAASTPTFFFRLHDASDDSVIGWEAEYWDEHDDVYRTKDYSEIEVDPLTECYVQVKFTIPSGTAGQNCDWVKLWEA